MIEIFAVTNRGIESICAEEMARLRGIQHIQVGYRCVRATFAGDIMLLLSLRTVDDIFIYLAEWQGIGSHRTTLALFEQLATELNLWQAASLRAPIQPMTDPVTFSVSANFVGRRNYNADEIKLAIASGVEAISGWHYAENDRQSILNLRVFIEHETAYVGLRLASSPLHRRTYKQKHIPGSLKPSVAAALLFLAKPLPKQFILDPCCGAGTILIEAATLGAIAMGGDQDAAAIVAAQSNAQVAGVDITAQVWDARALPLESASVHRVVTNLPWGRQVEVDAALEHFYRDFCAEMERILIPNGRIILLTNLPHLIAFPTLVIDHQIEISLFGQQPTIIVAGPPTDGADGTNGADGIV